MEGGGGGRGLGCRLRRDRSVLVVVYGYSIWFVFFFEGVQIFTEERVQSSRELRALPFTFSARNDTVWCTGTYAFRLAEGVAVRCARRKAFRRALRYVVRRDGGGTAWLVRSLVGNK